MRLLYLEIDLQYHQRVKAKHKTVFMVFISIYKFALYSKNEGPTNPEKTFHLNLFRQGVPFLGFPNGIYVFQMEYSTVPRLRQVK